VNPTRVVMVVLLAVGSVLGVDALADATQNRPDPIETGTRSTVVFGVDVRDGKWDEAAAALALWSTCASTVTHTRTVAGPDRAGDLWSVTLEPALGEHGRRRLVGCIEDATVDGVLGNVVNLTPHPS
jgi:hypothetical protein